MIRVFAIQSLFVVGATLAVEIMIDPNQENPGESHEIGNLHGNICYRATFVDETVQVGVERKSIGGHQKEDVVKSSHTSMGATIGKKRGAGERFDIFYTLFDDKGIYSNMIG